MKIASKYNDWDNVCVLFPGQGSQYPRMGLDILKNFEEANDIFQEASELLGTNLFEILMSSQMDTITSTEIAQVLIFTLSYAIFCIMEKHDISPKVVAGHSLGEYTAIVASGAATFRDTCKIVIKRGELMKHAQTHRDGTMVMIAGLSQQAVADLCQEAASIGIAVIANYNSKNQLVVSGDRKAIEYVYQSAQKQGALKATMLQVGGAFHSPLMKEAAEELSLYIERFPLQDPIIPIVMNSAGKLATKAEEIRGALLPQCAQAVLWYPSMVVIDNLFRPNIWLEMGPKRVLQGIIRSIFPEQLAVTLNDRPTVLRAIHSIQQYRERRVIT